MSSLFSNAGQMVKRTLPVALNSLFKISRRQVHFQDVLFGLENERNLARMMKLEKSGGPSMIMNALKYKIDIPFITDPQTIQGNDDTSRVFGLNKIKKAPVVYSDFPKGVITTVQDRHGLFEVSFQYNDPEKQWDPDRVLRLIAKTGLSDVVNSPTDNLFNGFLKKRGATRDDINRMYTAVFIKNASLDPEIRKEEFEERFVDGNPEQGVKPWLLDTFVKVADTADENTPSFTDVEFALFFLSYQAKDQYNMACLLNGGHLIKTGTVVTLLEEMLELLVKGDEETYKQKHREFMKATQGDTSTPPRSDKIITSFRQLPLFDLIFQQNSDFMARNFEALCVKIDAYLLNLVKPGEKLVVNLQFPFVFDGAPNIITLLVSAGEDDIINVEELLTDKSDPLSLMAKTVDSRLANSIKYCGTPSANIWILENPDTLSEKYLSEQKSLAQLNKLATNDEDVFKNKINALVALLTDKDIIHKFLDGRRFVTYGYNHWYEDCDSLARRGIITTVSEVKFSQPKNDPIDVKNISWAPILTFELSEKFKIEKVKSLNELPLGFSEPAAYPQHIGAASPLSPMNETGQLLTAEVFKKLTQKD